MDKRSKSALKPKVNIDFEKELWDAANKLRGTVAENQYKDYVLSLWFVKPLSGYSRNTLKFAFFALHPLRKPF